MFELMEKARNKKGFTLMEMLIVVAIIAILVAIIIPVFSSQLENARTAADAANIRSAYAMAQSCTLLDVNPSGSKATGTPIYYLQKDGDFNSTSGTNNYKTQVAGDADDCPAYGKDWKKDRNIEIRRSSGGTWTVVVPD